MGFVAFLAALICDKPWKNGLCGGEIVFYILLIFGGFISFLFMGFVLMIKYVDTEVYKPKGKNNGV